MGLLTLFSFNFVFLSLITIVGSVPFVSRSPRTVSVSIGRIVNLEPRDLFVFNSGVSKKWCKVEVIQNEPMTQRVGVIEPKIFDCNFSIRSVTYEHFGSPLLEEDLIKLRVLNFADNHTDQDTINVRIRILKKPYDLVSITRPLLVKEFFGLSRPIDNRVLKFHVEDNCRVRLVSKINNFNTPLHGRIVSNSRRVALDPQNAEFRKSCKEFLYLGLRYEHLQPPTPREDYVVLLIEAEEPKSLAIRHEWIHIKVVIEPALPNVVPKALFGTSLTFHVEQESSTLLTRTILSVTDEETPSDRLVFNITKGFSPFQGYFYHILDSTRPVSSFRQRDIDDGNIAYCPPDTLDYDRLLFQIHFDIWDSDFGVSESPVNLLIVLRRPSPSSHRKPQISVKTGLILLEGQSRSVLPEHLRLTAVPPLSRSVIQFVVISGPRYGQLLVSGKPSSTFMWSHVERGFVVYRHDDTDTTQDALYLRMAEEPDSVRIKFPITIIPKDDTPPTLVVNLGLELERGGIVTITPLVLKSVDSDSSADKITYNIVRKPRRGLVLRSFAFNSTVVTASNFTQADLNDGFVLYQHDGSEDTTDDFEVSLSDDHFPDRNVASKFTINVVVVRLNDIPPRPTPAASMSSIVLETEVLFITSSMLHYTDLNKEDRDISFDVNGRPRPLMDGGIMDRSVFTDAGKLVLLEHSVFENKSELLRLPETTTFRQEHINHKRLAYIPPQNEIGTTLLTVHFEFRVRDRFGNHLYGQHFNITVIPVNDKPPVLYTGVLIVTQGNSSVVTTHALSISDEDTPIEDLEIMLQRPPQFGVLMVNRFPLSSSHNFTMSDVSASKVLYVHRGSKATTDRISVIVSDRVHTVQGSILVHIMPAKEATKVTIDDKSAMSLTVNEGDDIVITSDVLTYSVTDDYSDKARFFVVQNPNYGTIQVDGKQNEAFTQDDLMSGKVKYVHSGSEIGMSAKFDDIHFTLVNEKPGVQGRSGVDSVHTLNITILPVDNVAPRLETLGQIKVFEGAKAALGTHLINAQDIDSAMQNVAFVISRQPRWGFLENVRPSPGSEINNTGIAISSFYMKDLQDESVNYVQLEHKGIEQTNDSFVLYATDGKRRSSHVVFNVSIVPVNDEEPVVVLQNFTVSQGSDKILDTEIFNVSDMDRPSDSILIRLQVPPRHGAIVLQVGDIMSSVGESKNVFEHFSELDWIDFERFSVIYRHNGTSAENDSFTLLVFDGIHSVQRTAVISVTPEAAAKVTQTHPLSTSLRIVNNGIRDVAVGDMRLIPNTALSTEFVNVQNNYVSYVLKSVPQFGVLQLGRYHNVWLNLTENGVFTQEDIDSLSLRYVHLDKLQRSGTKDSFAFSVYTNRGPLAESQIQTFSIEIREIAKPKDVLLTIENVEVESGGEVILGSSIIRVNSGTNRPSDLVFRVLNPPTQGRIVRSRKIGRTIDNFTLVDILRNEVVYVHSGNMLDTSGWSSEDRFQIGLFMGNNAVSPARVVDVTVQIKSLERVTQPPTTTDAPLSVQLVVQEDGAVVLQTMDFRDSNFDAAYSLVEQPQYGDLLLDGYPLATTDSSFVQRDIEDGRVSYQRHLHSGSASDLVRLRVSVPIDSRNAGVHQRLTNYREINLEIAVETFDDDEPSIKLELHSPDTLDNFESNLQGFVLTDHNVRIVPTTDIRLSDATINSLHYVVRKQPIHGRLERVDGKMKSGVMEFRPDDIVKKRIRYVLEDPSRLATSDQFDLSVVDEEDIVLALSTMTLQWSLVSFVQTVYEVCEDVGTVAIQVSRSSNLEHSSFVGIRVVGGTARQRDDFKLSRIRQLQFDPGVRKVFWDVVIENDSFDEEQDVETIQVRLRDPVNVVISNDAETVIKIKNKKRGLCSSSVKPKPINVQQPQMQQAVCNSNTIGSPLTITVGQSNVHLICDGNTWVSSSTSLFATTPSTSDLTTTGGRRRSSNLREFGSPRKKPKNDREFK